MPPQGVPSGPLAPQVPGGEGPGTGVGEGAGTGDGDGGEGVADPAQIFQPDRVTE
eukprot:CAMPEP_0115293462 /NCGR_PEP_ID=MMETSP0270-20121206/65673_1 /TAXON_ID=71861 /ORGANISM="Scrippsiella trochoidea, Strain CCMP3099" /LENGTH=54 /DNA_ID=CAMNT_0002710945 /DNA_START=21 /DNA_END=185 /DNA_ORIENTATION=+